MQITWVVSLQLKSITKTIGVLPKWAHHKWNLFSTDGVWYHASIICVDFVTCHNFPFQPQSLYRSLYKALAAGSIELLCDKQVVITSHVLMQL